jgi:Polysaccharide deacetylase
MGFEFFGNAGCEFTGIGMNLIHLAGKARNRIRRGASEWMWRRLVFVRPALPIVSFSFDDFPRSALHDGGAVLENYRIRGTYYVALGLMNQQTPAGKAFTRKDLETVIEKGHELGCHTFRHSHAWETPPSEFEESILENRRALEGMIPGAAFKSLSYPIAWPRPGTKRRAARFFSCCRGGGGAFNAGPCDASNLNACFLEKNADKPDALKRLVDKTCRASGWLIFATHDVCGRPTKFGCSSQFFEDLVAHTVSSGAKILPVGEAWIEILRGREPAS